MAGNTSKPSNVTYLPNAGGPRQTPGWTSGADVMSEVYDLLLARIPLIPDGDPGAADPAPAHAEARTDGRTHKLPGGFRTVRTNYGREGEEKRAPSRPQRKDSTWDAGP